jgi:lipoate-protein ligase A
MYDAALRARACDPIRNLALEESLLERDFGFESAVLVYVNEPCVVIGRNQNPWIEVSASAGIAVLRRVSGGGAVYHDRGNLNWSIIVPRSRHDREAELASVAAAIRALGVETETSPRGGLFVAGDGPWAGAKVSGSARRLSSARVLHHGTLLVDADLARLSSCLGGIEAVATKALPSVRSRSVNLSSLVPGLKVEEAAYAIARELSGAKSADAEALADPGFSAEAARRLGSWEWTWGSTPAFSLELPWSGGRALVEVRGGLVASASGPGAERLEDFMGRRFTYGFSASAALALAGCRTSREQEL